MPAQSERVEPVASLQEFFKDSISQALRRQGVEVEDHTAYYVVNLLTLFSRSEALYERTAFGVGLKPLALMLADAAESSNPRERNFVLQRLGDVSLFIAGFFADSLARKPVDIDYYVRMGGSAYGSLCESVRGTLRGEAFGSVFAELSGKFQNVVDVLNDVRNEARTRQDQDVLRLYETWLRTGSKRAELLLRELGIEPNSSLDSDAQH
jgi:hypothetical protein